MSIVLCRHSVAASFILGALLPLFAGIEPFMSDLA